MGGFPSRSRTGIENFSAIAYDQVGNQAQDEVEVEVIRSGGAEQ